MKKVVSLFAFPVVFLSCSFFAFAAEGGENVYNQSRIKMPASYSTDAVNKSISTEALEKGESNAIVITYDSFEDAKKAGEEIFYEDTDFSGYLLFQSACRIGESNKFAVTYVRAQ